jgi:hypothetical protein
LAGLADRPRRGRPTVDEAEVVMRTLEGPPEELGVTRWSSRLLGAELGLSNVSVARVWREWGMQPWRPEPVVPMPGRDDLPEGYRSSRTAPA